MYSLLDSHCVLLDRMTCSAKLLTYTFPSTPQPKAQAKFYFQDILESQCLTYINKEKHFQTYIPVSRTYAFFYHRKIKTSSFLQNIMQTMSFSAKPCWFLSQGIPVHSKENMNIFSLCFVGFMSLISVHLQYLNILLW